MPLPAAVGPLLRDLVNGNCCLFVGSAFSTLAAKFGSAHKICTRLATSLPDQELSSVREGDLPDIAKRFQNYHSRRALLKILWEEFNIEQANIKQDEKLLEFLISFNWQTIYTTNYDPLIEHVLNAHDQATRVVTRNIDLIHVHAKEIPILKIHGSINELALDQETPLVISDDDYFDTHHQKNRELLFSRLSSDLAQYTFLFIGFGLEYFFRNTWSSIFSKISPGPRGLRIQQQQHYAVQKDASKAIVKFWNGYGVRIINEDLRSFAQRMIGYKKKVITTQSEEYFPHLEKKFFKSRGLKIITTQSSYDKIIWDISYALFVDAAPPSKLELTKRELRKITNTSIYLSAVTLSDLKTDVATKAELAKTLKKNLADSLQKHTGEQLELTVSAAAWLWNYLDVKEHRQLAHELTSLLATDDVLVVYKISQLPMHTHSGLLARSVLDFLSEDATSRLLDPQLRKPVSRLSRQLMHPLASAVDDIESPSIEDYLLNLFESTHYPLIAWDLGAAIADRFRWEPDFRTKLCERIELAASKGTDESRVRYAYVILRERQIGKLLRASAQKRFESVFSSLKKHAPRHSRTKSSSLFRERLALNVLSTEFKTTDDFFEVADTYLREAQDSNFSRFFVMLSLPAIARDLPHQAAAETCSKALELVKLIPSLAQPFFYSLCEVVLRNIHDPKASNLAHYIPEAVKIFTDSAPLRSDDWSRFMLARLLSILAASAHKSFDRLTAERASDSLNQIADNDAERITIRGAASTGLSSTKAP